MVSPKFPDLHLGLSRLQKLKALARGLKHGAPVVEVAAAHLERFSGRENLNFHQKEMQDKHLENILSRASVSDICRLLKRKFSLPEQHRLVEELEKRYWNIFHKVLYSLIEYYVHRVDPKLLLKMIVEDIEEQKHSAEWPDIGITTETLLVRNMHHLHEFRATINKLLVDNPNLDFGIKIQLASLSSKLTEKRYQKIIDDILRDKRERLSHPDYTKTSNSDRGIDP